MASSSFEEVGTEEPESFSEETTGWEALPAAVQRKLSENGAPVSASLLWNMFLSEDDIASFIEDAGFTSGSVEWFRYSELLFDLWQGAQYKASLAARTRSVRLAAHYGYPP
ncbi:hypothetical protein AK812_SmicGene44606, partial [Symbiodinium microadriaticum]